MNRWIVNALGLAGIAVLLILGWAGFQLGAAAIVLRADLPDLAPTVARLDQALDTINHPCAPGPCGTLANIDKLAVKIGDLAVTSQRQEAQVGVLVAATAHNLDTVGDSVKQVAGSLSGTAQSATGLLQQGKADLVTANGAIADLRPLLTHSDSAVTDLDALLKDQAITATLTNVQNMTAQGQAILGDARNVADDATAKYFKPLPAWRRAMPYVTTGAKIAAYALPW